MLDLTEIQGEERFRNATTGLGAALRDLTPVWPEVAAAPVDQGTAAAGSGTSPSSGAAPTTSQANEILIGAIGTEGPNGDNAGTWSNSFTNGQRLGTAGGGAANNSTISEGYRIVSATGAYTAAKTGITSRAWGAVIATFKEAGGSPPANQSMLLMF
jgi:hypothetical protein